MSVLHEEVETLQWISWASVQRIERLGFLSVMMYILQPRCKKTVFYLFTKMRFYRFLFLGQMKYMLVKHYFLSNFTKKIVLKFQFNFDPGYTPSHGVSSLISFQLE